VMIVPLEGSILCQEDASRVNELKGGLYVCLTTSAYGAMTGVLDRIYRWLGTSAEYAPDGERTWYARYIIERDADGVLRTRADFERFVSVECCVPIILQK
jgi:AraC family transcriptional regulator